jgi:hypothetical protein
MKKENHLVPKLNVHITSYFNVYIRAGLGASGASTPNSPQSTTASTLKFSLYIRGL